MSIEFAFQFIIIMGASDRLLLNHLFQTVCHVCRTLWTTCGKIFKCKRGRRRSTPFETAMTLEQRNKFITKNNTSIVANTNNVFLILFLNFFLQRFVLLSKHENRRQTVVKREN